MDELVAYKKKSGGILTDTNDSKTDASPKGKPSIGDNADLWCAFISATDFPYSPAMCLKS